MNDGSLLSAYFNDVSPCCFIVNVLLGHHEVQAVLDLKHKVIH